MTKLELTTEELEKFLEDPKNVVQMFMGAFVEKYGYDHNKVKASISETKGTETMWKGKLWNSTSTNAGMIGLQHPTFNLVLSENTTDCIEVYMISAKKQGRGIGTRVMEQVLDLADELGIDVTLIPSPYKNKNDKQYLSFLRKWYYDLGFDHNMFSPVMKYKAQYENC